MRWLQILLALSLCALGVAWLLPGPMMRLAGALPGLADAGGAVRAWIGTPGGLVAPWLPIGLGLVSLLATIVPRGAHGMAAVEIVFDATAPHYVEHDVWRNPANEPLPGRAYRVGIRNRARRTVHDAMVIITVEEGRPATARFIRHKTYTSDIEPLGTELAELFMISDQDVESRLAISQTVKVRVSAVDAAPSARVFRFDSRASVPLVPV